MLQTTKQLNIRKINQVFEESKYSKREVVARCGFTRPTLDGLLRGSDVKISTLIAWAECFNRPIGFFFDEETKVDMHSEGNNSPVANDSVVTVSVGDALLAERVKALESLLAEKDERIKDLKDRIDDLKQQV